MNKFIAYLRTKSFRNNLIVAILAMVALLSTISYSLKIYTRHGEHIMVPKLRGALVENAIQILESQGLRYQIDSIYVVDKAAGLVVEQDPDPNTSVKTNRTVYLTITTREIPSTGFPDIEGKTFLEAQAILASCGFNVGDTAYTAGVTRDMVLKSSLARQVLHPGQLLHKGSRIDLILGDGKGASEVDIPDLTGLNLNEARMALLGSSLVLGHVDFDSFSDKDSVHARIIKQYPAPSDTLTKVNIGTRIDIILSK